VNPGFNPTKAISNARLLAIAFSLKDGEGKAKISIMKDEFVVFIMGKSQINNPES
jgi:hypothetical protein